MDQFNRPQWDDYYLAYCFLISRRSLDPATQHGAVIVSSDNRPLSSGYNGPLKGSKDEDVPLTRPEKYFHFLHGEENALLAYCGSHQDVVGATAYITGPPCYHCLRMLIQKGIKRIIYGPVGSAMIDKADEDAKKLMLETGNVVMKEHDNLSGVRNCLIDALKYFVIKSMKYDQDTWVLVLNKYQRDNLLNLINVAGYPYHVDGQKSEKIVEPFNEIHNGDWLGEIGMQLAKYATPYNYTLDNLDRANKSAEMYQQDVNRWLERKIKEWQQNQPSSQP